jgi:hypothetical protein
MNPTRFLFSFALSLGLLLAACLPASAQKALDSISLRYNFVKGATIRYRVIAYDSIVLYDKHWRTLARERAEVVQFHCDSVLPADSGYIMTIMTTGYAATERIDSLPPITRDTAMWVNRPITFLMSVSGRRLKLKAASDDPGTSPGGPFEPLLLPYLGDDRTYVGSSGAYPTEQYMFDNVFPPVFWKGSTFRTIVGRMDTLKQKVLHVTLSDVGNLSYRMPGSDDNPATSATVNGAGDYYLGTKLGYPIGGTYNLIARFTMARPGKEKVDGRHILGMYFELLKEE